MILVVLLAFIVVFSYGYGLNETGSYGDNITGHGYGYDGCQEGELIDLLNRAWCWSGDWD